jgi:hypothetical protein
MDRMRLENLQKPKKKIQSSIPELSVGDERKCFNQIRKAAAYIKPDSLLWNGWPAGKFALDYVIGHHMKRKKKAEEKQESLPEHLKRKRKTRTSYFDEMYEVLPMMGASAPKIVSENK